MALWKLSVRFASVLLASGAVAAMTADAPLAQTASTQTAASVTFAKDVAPIFQAKCETCHRPGDRKSTRLNSSH